jgi:hypothetical protein
MGDQYAYAREVVVSKRPPQALIEATDSVVGIGGTLTVWYAVEEVAIVGSLLPHALHLGRTWLEVAKVLFSYPRFFEDGDLVARKGRWGGFVGRECAQDAFGGLAGSTVG